MRVKALRVNDASISHLERTKAHEVLLGCKKTEIGILPEDWNIKALADVCTPQGIVRGPFGGALKKAMFVTSGFKVYEQRNAIHKSCSIGSYFVDQTKYTEMHRFSISPDDFIISCSGTIGRIYRIPPDAPPGIINQALLKLTTNKNIVDDQFFYILFEWDDFQTKIIDSTQGGAMKNLVGMNVFKTTPVVLPPLPEQTAIAEALSGMDRLLDALGALIAKKRAIKQTAMQQLLTGKTRLPGFSGEWETKRLGEVEACGDIRLYRGKVISKREIDQNLGDYPIYSSSVHSNGLFGYYGEYMFEEELITWSVDGGGHFFYRFQHRFSVTNVCGYIRIKTPQIHCRYLAYHLQELHSHKAFDYTLKAHPSVIRSSYKISLPEVEEQRAIAAALSDMDTEITMLEHRHDKARAIKQGMMQQLLTGHVRLAKQQKIADA